MAEPIASGLICTQRPVAFSAESRNDSPLSWMALARNGSCLAGRYAAASICQHAARWPRREVELEVSDSADSYWSAAHRVVR